ncbi:MAG: Fur family transcriptional regulator [Candidatus Hydrogenedentota bacterium]
MAVSREMVERRMAGFREACVSKQLRVTYQRMEIYRAVASSETHPDAEAIHHTVRKYIPSISPDTVYRNLRLLADYGLVSIVGMSDERLRFDANMELHHHFVCVECGLIRDFSSHRLEHMKFPKEAEAFGTPFSSHLEVQGICSKCQKRNKRAGRKLRVRRP